MDKFTIACVQMRLRLPASLDECRDDLQRYMRATEAKRARLIVFPELAGLMVVPPLLRDGRSSMLLREAVGQRRDASAWKRLSGGVAGSIARALKADLRASLSALLEADATRVWEQYLDLFGGLAKTHGVTVVAPSAYLPDAESGVVCNTSAVFGPSGELLGRQSKVMGSPEDEGMAQRGRTWDVIPTEVGRVGVMLGADALYPEVGRLLAYQNAEVLVLQAACPSTAAFNKLRAGILARMQDNQLYAAASFLVGAYPFRPAASTQFQGRSAVFAPQQLTPRGNGVLVEMGSPQSEGIVTAEWDYSALRRLWETSETPLRRPFQEEQATVLLSALYTQLRALPQQATVELLEGDGAVESEAGAIGATAALAAHGDSDVHELEELPVLGSVTSRWPLGDQTGPAESVTVTETLFEWPSPASHEAAAPVPEIRRDDETDEMDAVHGAENADGAEGAHITSAVVALSDPSGDVAEAGTGAQPSDESVTVDAVTEVVPMQENPPLFDPTANDLPAVDATQAEGTETENTAESVESVDGTATNAVSQVADPVANTSDPVGVNLAQDAPEASSADEEADDAFPPAAQP